MPVLTSQYVWILRFKQYTQIIYLKKVEVKERQGLHHLPTLPKPLEIY